MNLLDNDEVLQLAREDLACYAQALWPGFELAAHHELIVDMLELVERGEILRLLICLPPRHGKSLLASLLFPAWFLGRNPQKEIICASYGQDLADDFGRQVRNLVNDPKHRFIFPEFRLTADSNSMRRFRSDAGGGYFAVGRGGAVTGRGADLLILDDPLKDAAEAGSELIRRSLYDWYQAVGYTRLQPRGRIVLVATRWHEDDLTGRLLRQPGGEDWHILNLPAVAELDEGFRRAGQALWPEKFPLSVLERIRREVGSAVWSSLYQQKPSAAEGTIFKREWFCYYREQPRFKRLVQSVDTAFKVGADNDYSAITTWGVGENGFYLVWFWRDKAEFPELKRKVKSLASAYSPNQILVEDRASGQSLVQELKAESRLPIVPIKVDTDKISRAQAITPLMEAGKVFLPEGAPWLADYVDELCSFPTGVHDDAVDSTTQALNFLRHEQRHTVSIRQAFTGEYLGGTDPEF